MNALSACSERLRARSRSRLVTKAFRVGRRGRRAAAIRPTNCYGMSVCVSISMASGLGWFFFASQ